MADNRIIKNTEAKKFFNQLGKDFAIINNPEFIFPNYELVPLAPINKAPLKGLKAIVMDMDGTTTTTEELCTYSLEVMVRKITGQLSPAQWKGLDHIKDYPNIIGNSTTKHVEYLIKKYGKGIVKKELSASYIYASLWTLLIGQDKSRKMEVTSNMINLGLSGIFNESKYIKLSNKQSVSSKELNTLFNSLKSKYITLVKTTSFNDNVKAAIDIYYQKYHEILLQIDNGQSKKLSKQFFGDPNKRLIEPMPGVPVFLALIKGWLGEDIKFLAEDIINNYYNNSTSKNLNKNKITDTLVKLSRYFTKHPVKVAVVTSSIYYEANIVLKEVFQVIQEEIDKWEISDANKIQLKEKFADHHKFYDGFITASDSNEIRLKPHRDLYSIALHQLDIPQNEFDQVIGLEDSESGTIAIRAAGVGLCVAVPFTKTTGHNFNAATYVANKGLSEIILKYNCFLK
jgi:beta-phosphoglucomutase-like phosphatase (HAD superfamily)